MPKLLKSVLDREGRKLIFSVEHSSATPSQMDIRVRNLTGSKWLDAIQVYSYKANPVDSTTQYSMQMSLKVGSIPFISHFIERMALKRGQKNTKLGLLRMKELCGESITEEDP